jgi:hypothetical protein
MVYTRAGGRGFEPNHRGHPHVQRPVHLPTFFGALGNALEAR